MKKEKKTARPGHHRIFIKFFHRVHVAPSTRGEASLFLKVVFLLNENVGIGSIITLASALSINKATGAPRPPIITLASAPRELSNGSGMYVVVDIPPPR